MASRERESRSAAPIAPRLVARRQVDLPIAPRLVARRHVDLVRVSSALCS